MTEYAQMWFSGISAYVTSFEKIQDMIFKPTDTFSGRHLFDRFYEENFLEQLSKLQDHLKQGASTIPLSALKSCIINEAIIQSSDFYNYVELNIESGQGFLLFFNAWLKSCVTRDDINRIIEYNESSPVRAMNIFKCLVIPREVILSYDWKESTQRQKMIETNLYMDNAMYYDYDESLSFLFQKAKEQLLASHDSLSLCLINSWVTLLSASINEEDNVEYGIPGRPGVGTMLNWLF